jgi:hypothetical protein
MADALPKPRRITEMILRRCLSGVVLATPDRHPRMGMPRNSAMVFAFQALQGCLSSGADRVQRRVRDLLSGEDPEAPVCSLSWEYQFGIGGFRHWDVLTPATRAPPLAEGRSFVRPPG